ncbi:MAG: hypothetical protein ACJ762_18135 [Solirubrobacteraceae bacterium]
MRRVLLILTAGALLALAAAPAPAYPPITCGKTSVRGTAYVVRTHGPNCTKAIGWTRTFMLKGRSPAGWRCKAYGADAPAVCIRNHHKNTYFNATKA